MDGERRHVQKLFPRKQASLASYDFSTLKVPKCVVILDFACYSCLDDGCSKKQNSALTNVPIFVWVSSEAIPSPKAVQSVQLHEAPGSLFW